MEQAQGLRWGRMLIAIAIGVIVSLLLVTVATEGWHRYQVQANDGVWCVRFNPEGVGQRLYGDDCSFVR